MKNVLLIKPTIRPIGVEYFQKHSNVYVAPNGEEATLIEMINNHNIHAIITRTEEITKQVIDHCPSLEVIGQHGVGVNNIDVPAATEKKIKVVHVPDANITSVAEHTMMLILSLSKNLINNDTEVRKGNWDFRDQVLPIDIRSKNLFIVGFGNIGKEVAKLALAFHMNVYVFDPFIKKSDLDVTIVERIEDGLAIADFTTLHIPLIEATKRMFTREYFRKMKNTSYFINVSRGQIVEHEALVEALENKWIAGAGLDVMEEEPPNSNDPLLTFENVILTPHHAGDTLEAKNRCSTILSKEVISVLKGNDSNNIFNKQVLNK